MRKVSCTLFAICLSIIASFNAVADSYDNIVGKPLPERLVNDFSGIFLPGQRADLEERLVAFDDSTSNQICIVVLDDLSGYDVAQYALLLGNKWGVGGPANNGVTMLIKPRTKNEPYIDVSIQVGRGLEGAVPDVYASRIIRNVMGPLLKEDKYFEAVNAACDELMALACGEISEPGDDEDTAANIAAAALVVFLILLLVLLLFSRGNDSSGGNGSSGGSGRSGGIWPLFIPGSSRGGYSGGSSFGSGGFGGFGGGSFGGGGASGRF